MKPSISAQRLTQIILGFCFVIFGSINLLILSYGVLCRTIGCRTMSVSTANNPQPSYQSQIEQQRVKGVKTINWWQVFKSMR